MFSFEKIGVCVRACVCCVHACVRVSASVKSVETVQKVHSGQGGLHIGTALEKCIGDRVRSYIIMTVFESGSQHSKPRFPASSTRRKDVVNQC